MNVTLRILDVFATKLQITHNNFRVIKLTVAQLHSFDIFSITIFL